MVENWDGLIALLVVVGPVLFSQRAFHGELQSLLLILTRSEAATISIFSLLFIPGVLLHELSHFTMAKLLRVRTARFSLLPEVLPGGKLLLGFVETEQTDLLRDALIGVAPLLTGGLILAYLGLNRLGLAPLGQAFAARDWQAFWTAFRQMPEQTDFWIWFYLAISVATTMLPSESDRRAWVPILVCTALAAGAAVLVGAGPWMAENLAPALNNGLRAAALVFGISLGLHLLMWIPLRLLRAFAQRVTGLRLVTK